MPVAKKNRPYSETQLYRDASVYLQRLTRVVVGLPRPIQYSIGEMMLKDAMRVCQLMKLSYEAEAVEKLLYIREAKEKMACLEVSVNEMYECGYINQKTMAYLYLEIGKMQKQLRAWREKLIKQNVEIKRKDNYDGK